MLYKVTEKHTRNTIKQGTAKGFLGHFNKSEVFMAKTGFLMTWLIDMHVPLRYQLIFFSSIKDC